MGTRVLSGIFVFLFWNLSFAGDVAATRKEFGPSYTIPADGAVLQTVGSLASHAPLPESGLKVLVWNAYKGQREGWLEDFQRLTEQHHLFLMQEAVFEPASQAPLKNTHDREWKMAISFFDGPQATGVATACSAPSVETRFVRSDAREPFAGTPKMAIITRYQIGSSNGVLDTLTVVNVHAINFVFTSTFGEHMDQIDRELSRYSGPMILAGDFNTWSSGRMEILEALAAKHGLAHVLFADDSRATPLDHAMVRGLKVRSAVLLNSIETSDHTPLSLELDLRK